MRIEPSVKRRDGLLGGLPVLEMRHGQHRAALAVGLVPLDADLRRQLHPLALGEGRRLGPGRREAGELPEDAHDPAPTPEETALRKERQEALLRALETLSSGDRVLFYRKYYYRQPTAQIAAELGATERSVEGRLYRIRQKLKELLKGEMS